MKVLFVGNKPEKITCGGDQVNARNISLLESVFGTENLVFFPLGSFAGDSDPRGRIARKIKSLLRSMMFYAGGFDPSRERMLKDLLSETHFDWVFVSDVVTGRVVPLVKKAAPGTKTAVFFHNVMRLYAGEYVRSCGPSHFPFYFAACRNESLAVKHSEKLIVLNARESSLLEKFYKRKADLELPISYRDRFDSSRVEKSKGDITLLFVGINFFANAEGIRWFVSNVMPRVSAKLVIVGSGMDQLSEELTRGNVEVNGFVDDLDAFYYRADIMVLPIFSGGGMKTKTAEGMMFGKTIFGTAESFIGYDPDFARTGALCETADQFVSAIETFTAHRPKKKFNSYSREHFLAHYESGSLLEKFRSLFTEAGR
jgi:glycosyltransferase involved in cell wall biosynthesis